MKKIIFWGWIVLSFFYFSCSDKKATLSSDERKAFQVDSIDAHGVQRMQVSQVEQTVKWNNKNYTLSICRTPADSLPKIKNDLGDIYLDNKITLRINREKGGRVFNKVFTKRAFSDLIGEDFLSKSILEGMVFDKVTPQGFVFAASVSFPQTDLYVPISLLVSPEGKLTMRKEELMDETYSADEQN